jgi:hypothetical protein
MKRFLRRLSGVLLVLAVVPAAVAFSLLGPFKDGSAPNSPEGWQAAGFGGMPSGLGYSQPISPGSIGGPMFAHEAYRWNVPMITYAFDESFVRYFGTNGIWAIKRAFDILNNLPPASQMSANLTEFPLDARGVNNTAQVLGLNDIKSLALAHLLEELGLANPERFVWGLRGRDTGQNFTNYSVVKMNYDPVTLRPSSYVNGVLYSYQVRDPIGPQGIEWASAVEISDPDPSTQKYSSVAGAMGNPDLSFVQVNGQPVLYDSVLLSGQFVRGLTRDDAGGLRFLLNPRNVVTEDLLTNVFVNPLAFRSPWTPIIGTNFLTNAPGLTNIVGTNILATNVLRVALRGGVDKIQFRRVNFDSLIGQGFVSLTNTYTDTFITNAQVSSREVQRLIVQPDILFLAQDLGVVQGVPTIFSRTTTAGWQNNNLLNGNANQGGPGVITPQVQLTFTDNAPYFLRLAPGEFGSDLDVPFAWGSFDGSANTPIVYPLYLNYTLEDIARQVLQGDDTAPPFP